MTIPPTGDDERVIYNAAYLPQGGSAHVLVRESCNGLEVLTYRRENHRPVIGPNSSQEPDPDEPSQGDDGHHQERQADADAQDQRVFRGLVDLRGGVIYPA